MSGGQQQQNESQNQQTPQTRRSLFSFRHLIAVATAAVLAASGMVNAEDMAFVIFSIIYIYFLSNVAFPTLSPSMESRVFGQKNRAMGLYILVTALIGLFLPIAYIVLGIYEGDREGIKASAPHVFLLTIQVFMEGVFFSDRFSLPIWVFVPVFYNSRRIFTLVEWVRAEYSQSQIGEDGGNYNYNYNHWRLFVGRGLAIANLALWCFNLFGFLLPVFLPRAFKIYYSSSSSSGHDKVN